MNLDKLDETTHFVDSVRWSAIATGTIIALALQTMLLLLGLAFATSVGDHIPGGGFDVWLVIVELCAIGLGAALTARLSHAERRMQGVTAGIMTWAVVLVLGTVFQGLTMTRALGGDGVWAAFIGALVSLAAAMVGGALGVGIGSHESTARPAGRYEEPIAPVH
jgi:hypothetical protein